MNKHYIAAAVGALIVVLAIALQLAVSAGPRYDRQTESDLTSIHQAIKDYDRKHDRLPGSLNDLDLEPRLKARSAQRKYEYQQLDSTGRLREFRRFETCAEFKTDTNKSSYSSTHSHPRYHDSGRHCFPTEVY